MMIPRSLVKHQYKSIGRKGSLGGPAVLMFPAKGAHLVQLQPSNTADQRLCFEWVRQSAGKLCKCPCLKEPLLCRQVKFKGLKPSGESKGVHEPGAWRRKEQGAAGLTKDGAVGKNECGIDSGLLLGRYVVVAVM